MITRIFTVALPVVSLLGLAVVSGAQVALNAPAFSPSLREESILGDWRIAPGDAHFDRSDYYFQLGVGYLQADTAAIMMGSETLPGLDDFDVQMLRSIELLQRSVEGSPGHAGAWTNLAWAHTLRNQLDEAEVALRTSWRLAPLNFVESAERIALVAIFDARHRAGWRNDPDANSFVQYDELLLTEYNSEFLGDLSAEFEELFGE